MGRWVSGGGARGGGGQIVAESDSRARRRRCSLRRTLRSSRSCLLRNSWNEMLRWLSSWRSSSRAERSPRLSRREKRLSVSPQPRRVAPGTTVPPPNLDPERRDARGSGPARDAGATNAARASASMLVCGRVAVVDSRRARANARVVCAQPATSSPRGPGTSGWRGRSGFPSEILVGRTWPAYFPRNSRQALRP